MSVNGQTSQNAVAKYFVLKIMWLVLIGSVFIYGAVSYFNIQNKINSEVVTEEQEEEFLQKELPPEFLSQAYFDELVHKELFLPLAIVGIVVSIIALLLPKFLFKQSGGLKEPNPHKTTSPNLESLSYSGSLNNQTLSEDMIKKLFVPFVLRLALSESVAIFGFVLATVYNRIEYYFIFAIPAIALMAITFPNDKNLKKLVGLN